MPPGLKIVQPFIFKSNLEGLTNLDSILILND